jgi:hypothetical protein
LKNISETKIKEKVRMEERQRKVNGEYHFTIGHVMTGNVILVKKG